MGVSFLENSNISRAQKCPSFFPAYLVLGFGIMMVLQAFVNMSVAVGLVPVTGQTLPLISKGGTSILITSFYIGVILSVSRYAEKKEKKAPLVEAVPNGETSEYYTDGGMSWSQNRVGMTFLAAWIADFDVFMMIFPNIITIFAH